MTDDCKECHRLRTIINDCIKMMLATAFLFLMFAITACAPQRYTVGAIVTRDHEVSSKPPVPTTEYKQKHIRADDEEVLRNAGLINDACEGY